MPRKIHWLPVHSVDHPVYRLMADNPPDGWSYGHQESESDLVIAPTFPWYEGSKPWFVCIEDWVTLYRNDLANGSTAGVDVLNHPKTTVLRELFSRPNFRGIICHHRGTFQDLAYLQLTQKLHYVPVGIEVRPIKTLGVGQPFKFVFINSWNRAQHNFKLRGGELVLRAFQKVCESSHPNVKLNIVCGIDTDPDLNHWVENCPSVEITRGHIDDAQLAYRIAASDCLLIPGHRVHVHSILYPFSFGVPVIGSDGWGMDEYIVDGVNGFRLKGVYGHTSWRDTVFREDYSAWEKTLPAVDDLAETMLRLAADRRLTFALGKNARDYVNDVHPVSRTKKLLKQLFDSAC